MGDSFSSGGRQTHGTREGYKQQSNRGMNGTADPPRAPQPDGLAAGNLLLMPHRVALAAQADGWTVRNDTVWAKQSPMPESLRGWGFLGETCTCVQYKRRTRTAEEEGGKSYLASLYTTSEVSHLNSHHGRDVPNPSNLAAPDCPTCQGTGRTATQVLRRGSWRHTRAHEYVFMLCKSMGYFANSEAVREAASYGRSDQGNGLYSMARRADPRDKRDTPPVTNRGEDPSAGRNPRSALAPPATPSDALASLRAWLRTTAPDVLAAYEAAQTNPPSVLRPAASPLGLEHYASFPPSLVEPLIRASCPERVCQCGSPWCPVVERGTSSWEARKAAGHDPRGYHVGDTTSQSAGNASVRHLAPPGVSKGGLGWAASTTTHGLAPTCACPPGTPWQPGVCCDPFSGSATTGLVARALGRQSVLVEASAAYVALARERLSLDALAQWEGTYRPMAPVETFTDLPLFGG